MNVAVVGTGYVGLPTGVVLADLGHNVVCIDHDEDKIKRIASGEFSRPRRRSPRESKTPTSSSSPSGPQRARTEGRT
jgi:UDP-N-acetyl-D-mannosaminuronate dehydrogenase